VALDAEEGPADDWITNLNFIAGDLPGDYVRSGDPLPDELPKACRALFQARAKQVRGLFLYACALSPSGEAWAMFAAIEPQPDDEAIRWVPGSWHVVVAKAGRVAVSAPQAFRCAARGTCEVPSSCFENTHCEGVFPPASFWFYDLDHRPPHEAFAVSYEEPNTSGVSERSALLFSAVGPKPLALIPDAPSAIVGMRDCNADGRLEVVVNPYRTAGDDFVLNFGGKNRASASPWTLLLEHRPDGGFSADSELSRAYARRACPARPSRVFSERGDEWPARLHCAKLWGATPVELGAELSRACERPKGDRAQHFCGPNRSKIERMVAAVLPLRLAVEAVKPLPPGCFDQGAY
jgi:hypothetical protein